MWKILGILAALWLGWCLVRGYAEFQQMRQDDEDADDPGDYGV